MNNKVINRDWGDVLRPLGNFKKIQAGEPLLYQGEKTKTIGFILSGHAQASVFSEQGQETWVGTFKAGEFFGHTSFLTDTKIDFEIIAETDMKILTLPVQKFSELLSSDSALSTHLARDLAARLNIMTNRLVEAVTLSSPGRVCAELLRLSRPVGIDPDKRIVRPSPVFTELALRINSTRETVSRTVSDLQNRGILSREPGAVLINKPDSLHARIR